MTSYSNFQKRYDPEKLRKKIAELPSLYSDMERTFTISSNILTAKQALSLVYITLYFQYWETDLLTKAIAQKAYSQNYNGEWKKVQEFLETQFKTPEDFEKKYISDYGPHDFFGNFLPKAARYIVMIKVQDVNKVKKKKVVYAQYHRGYKDKGSLRLPSDFHGIRPYKEKEDRRQNVSHPLLSENFSTVEDGALGTHPIERRVTL